MNNKISETQKRITQKYMEITRKADYIGEHVPYGYELVPYITGENNGVCLTVSENEVKSIQDFYSFYSNKNCSLEEILEEANFFENVYPKISYRQWDRMSLSKVLLNPIYIKADEKAYEYFLKSGCIMHNPPEDFTEGNGCLVFSEHPDSISRYIIKSCHVLLVPHTGIVSFETWLKVREKWFRNRGN